MLKTFQNAYRVKNTYRVNSFIYSLKMIPLVGKLIPYNFYSDSALKILGYIVSGFMELLETFGYKLLYIFGAFFLPYQFFENPGPDVFLHIFFFMTLAGAFANAPLLVNSKDKFYAISLLKMDAKEYTVSCFAFYLLKVFLGMEIFMLIFCLIFGANPFIALLPGLFVVLVKIAYAALEVHMKSRTGRSPKAWSVIAGIVFVLLAYGLPFLGVVLNQWIFAALFLAFLGLAVFSLFYLRQFHGYRALYKAGLPGMDLILNPKAGSTAIISKRMREKIDYTAQAESSKSGYAYFHQLFMARHRKLLSRSANRIALVCLGLVAAVLAVLFFVPDTAGPLNHVPLRFLPYFTFLMYAINRGQTVTQAMFMNCDHSMLSYRFFRQPKDILGLFTKRLLSVVAINLSPALVIGGGLAAILYFSGGTDNPLNYVVLLASIAALSVFFSVHHLVMYYLLQPYNADVEMKSKMYNIVSGITYMVSYIFIQVELPTLEFGSAVIAFTLLYLVFSLVLAYKYAPKTFHLR